MAITALLHCLPVGWLVCKTKVHGSAPTMACLRQMTMPLLFRESDAYAGNHSPANDQNVGTHILLYIRPCVPPPSHTTPSSQFPVNPPRRIILNFTSVL